MSTREQIVGTMQAEGHDGSAVGTGKVYQAVAESTALDVQEAADQLRNIDEIATTAVGEALAQSLERPEPTLEHIIQALDEAIEDKRREG